RPGKGQDLVPKVLKWATEDTDNPDLRDRGYMYWRLLSSNPAAAKGIVMGEKPAITAESEKLDPATLEEMCLVVGTLATVYLKPVHNVFRSARARRLHDSPALQKERLPSWQAAQQAKLLTEQQLAGAKGANGRRADALEEADALFASMGGQSMAGMNDGFASSPTHGTHGEQSQMYIVNQGQGLGTMAPMGHAQDGGGEGDLLSF
ncbi:hypothetical protein LTR53_017357, partial [Teratosphaeriaceae sp. CCFEE 6253]